MYIDKVVDLSYDELPVEKTERDNYFTLEQKNTTTIGGIMRGSSIDLPEPSHYIVGTINDVRIWSRALSQTEINNLYDTALWLELEPEPEPEPN